MNIFPFQTPTPTQSPHYFQQRGYLANVERRNRFGRWELVFLPMHFDLTMCFLNETKTQEKNFHKMDNIFYHGNSCIAHWLSYYDKSSSISPFIFVHFYWKYLCWLQKASKANEKQRDSVIETWQCTVKISISVCHSVDQSEFSIRTCECVWVKDMVVISQQNIAITTKTSKFHMKMVKR